MSQTGKFLDIEIRGGLGDLILQLHETTAWEELDRLDPNDRARVTIISHNPYADELFKWHPKLSQIEVVKSRHFFMPPYNDPRIRLEAGVQEREPAPRPPRERKPQSFYAPQAELDLLEVELPRVPFLAIAPTASGMEIENRNIPDSLLNVACIATLRRSIPIVWLGRTYQGPHAPKAVPFRPVHHDIVDMTDRLSVPGTLEALRRAKAGLFAHSALLQYAWLNRIPNFVLYPPMYKHHDFDNPSPFGKGKDLPETTRMLFTEFRPSAWDAFLTKHFKRGNAP